MNGQNFMRLLQTGQLTDDPSNKLSPIFVRLAEVLVILAVMYGGFRVTLNNMQSEVYDLKNIVGASRNTKSLCERTTELETSFAFIEKSLKSIDEKLDRRAK